MAKPVWVVMVEFEWEGHGFEPWRLDSVSDNAPIACYPSRKEARERAAALKAQWWLPVRVVRFEAQS